MERARASKLFHEAIAILDASEPKVRDIIESGLMDVSDTIGGAMAAADRVTVQVMKVRRAALREAFKHIREGLSGIQS